MKGKLKSFACVTDTSHLTFVFLYDTTTGKLQEVTSVDAFLTYKLVHVNDQLIRLDSEFGGNHDVIINGDRVEQIIPTSPENNFNQMGLFDWDLTYSPEGLISEVFIDYDLEWGLIGTQPNFYSDGRLFDFEFDENYERVLYSYVKNGDTIVDTFIFEYTSFDCVTPLPIQNPLHQFEIDYFWQVLLLRINKIPSANKTSGDVWIPVFFKK